MRDSNCRGELISTVLDILTSAVGDLGDHGDDCCEVKDVSQFNLLANISESIHSRLQKG